MLHPNGVCCRYFPRATPGNGIPSQGHMPYQTALLCGCVETHSLASILHTTSEPTPSVIPILEDNGGVIGNCRESTVRSEFPEPSSPAWCLTYTTRSNTS